MKVAAVPYKLILFTGCIAVLFHCTKIDFDYGEDEGGGPSITLFGPNPYPLNIGDTYIDPGAKATDTEDGDISSDIVIDYSSVNTYAEGEYTAYYSVTDKDQNTTSTTRSVIVKDGVGTDKEKPELRLNGDNPYYLNTNDTYVDPGATATDNIDGNITYKIEKYDTLINTSSADTHTVYYVVKDEAGNVAMTIRTVIVIDNTGEDTIPPVITVKGPNPINLKVGYSYNEYGASAMDNFDGDLTSQIDTNSSEVDTSLEGTYSVYYTVSDKAGNEATEIRTVKITDDIPDDTIPPVITLNGANPMTVYIDSSYDDPGATATDDVDGNLTDQITVDTSQVNTSQETTFKVTYSVSDKAGNSAQKERTVNVVPENFVDTIPPVITLKGSNPVNLSIGSPYIEPGATAVDNMDGTITDKIVIDTSEVNVMVGGSYKVYYSVSDAAGNTANKTRTVNVEDDTEPPVITLLGDNSYKMNIYDAYVEAGAYAKDNIDDSIPFSEFTVSDNIDSTTEGIYTVNYTVSDQSGNEAKKTRAVEVIDSGNAKIDTFSLTMRTLDKWANNGSSGGKVGAGARGGSNSYSFETLLYNSLSALNGKTIYTAAFRVNISHVDNWSSGKTGNLYEQDKGSYNASATYSTYGTTAWNTSLGKATATSTGWKEIGGAELKKLIQAWADGRKINNGLIFGGEFGDFYVYWDLTQADLIVEYQ